MYRDRVTQASEKAERVRGLLALFIVAAVSILLHLAISREAHAQSPEASVPPILRMWFVGNVDRVGVSVIETTGTCIYVARQFSESAAIAVVPKTALPAGVGCQ